MNSTLNNQHLNAQQSRLSACDRILSLGGIFIISMALLGCKSVPAISPGNNASSPMSQASPETTTLGQMLPISAQVKVADQVIQLEVARTLDEQAMGLMYRSKLDANRGMLFSFNPPRPVNFWMKNVLINLDMVFLQNNEVVAVASNVPPCKEEPCVTYGPQEPVDQVIELRGGRANELGIKPGDRLTVQFLSSPK